MISAVILVKNEEENITHCLKSLTWCDEIIVIDDFSEDETLKRIMNYESRIKDRKIKKYKRHLNGNFAAQRNYGLSKTSGEWILFVDADELVTDDLQSEIKAKTQMFAMAENCAGFYLRRKDYFLGTWLLHGESGDIKFIRLAKKTSGWWIGRVHEVWKVQGKVGELKNHLEHYPHPTVSKFLSEINFYSDLVVQAWWKDNKYIPAWQICIYPLGKFVKNYIMRLGFLDGVPGLIMAIMMSFHSFLCRSKYYLGIKNE